MMKDIECKILIVAVFIVCVFRFFEGRFILEQCAFERCYVRSSEYRRVAAAPEKPHKVPPALTIRRAFGRIERLTRKALGVVEIFAAGKHFAVAVKLHEAAVVIAGHTAVEKQVSVVAKIYASRRIKITYMRLQTMAVFECARKLFEQKLLGLCKPRRVARIDCRKILVAQLVLYAVYRDGHVAVIDARKHVAIIHFIFGTTSYDLTLEL